MAGIERYDPFDGALGISLATRVGSTVYVSGTPGFDAAQGGIPSDLEAEIRAVFSNLQDILVEMGSSLEQVLEMTNFLVGDPSAVYPMFDKVRSEVFGKHLPASASVFVQALVSPEMHCEVKLSANAPD
jgi:enamine deaminase RidA (YjgF/YER057c/UK114 family)